MKNERPKGEPWARQSTSADVKDFEEDTDEGGHLAMKTSQERAS